MARRKPLAKLEMLKILEDIARNGQNAAARIAAIKQLGEMQSGEQPSAEGFAALDELQTRRDVRTKTA